MRDIAAAHVTAMTAPGAAGQRFLLGSDPALEMTEIAGILRARLGEAAAHVPIEIIPDDTVWASAAANPALRSAVKDLGYARRFSARKGAPNSELGSLPERGRRHRRRPKHHR